MVNTNEKTNKQRNQFKYSINENKIDIADPIFCYFAGLVATDGYLDKNVTRVTIGLSGKEDDILLKNLANYFEYEGDVYRHGKNMSRSTLCMSSEKLINELRKMGIERFSNKTKEVKTPKSFINDDCKRMYVRGCIDGDGNIKSKSGIVRLLCGSESLVDGLISIIKEKGIEIDKSYSKRANGKSYPYFELKVRPSLELLHWIYQDYDEYRLPRKYKQALDIWGEDLVNPILPPFNGNNMLYREKDWLEDKVYKGLSIPQIAKLCNCAPSAIGRWIKIYKLKYIPRNSGWVDEYIERNGLDRKSIDWVSLRMPYRDRDWLIARLNEGMGVRTISREYNIDRGTIKKWIKIHNIPYIASSSPKKISRVKKE